MRGRRVFGCFSVWGLACLSYLYAVSGFWGFFYAAVLFWLRLRVPLFWGSFCATPLVSEEPYCLSVLRFGVDG